MAVVLINGTNYSASNFNNIAFGVPVVGIAGLNYKIKQVKENNYSLEADPTSRGYGQITYEGSITVYREWWQSVINAAPNKSPLQIGPFDWTIVFGNLGQPLITETLQNFEFLEDGVTVAAGDTKLLQEIPIIFAGIKR